MSIINTKSKYVFWDVISDNSDSIQVLNDKLMMKSIQIDRRTIDYITLGTTDKERLVKTSKCIDIRMLRATGTIKWCNINPIFDALNDTKFSKQNNN